MYPHRHGAGLQGLPRQDATTLTGSQVQQLESMPSVRAVVPDSVVSLARPPRLALSRSASAGPFVHVLTRQSQPLCSCSLGTGSLIKSGPVRRSDVGLL